MSGQTVPRIRHRANYIWHHTRKRRVAGALFLLFALANGFTYLAFRQQTYPRATIIGHPIGSVPTSALPERIRQMPLLPQTIALRHKDSSETVAVSTLGLSVDVEQTARELAIRRSWPPVANFFVAQDVPLYIAVEPKIFQRKIHDIGRAYRTPPADASLSHRNGDFVIVPEKSAQLLDVSGSQARIIAALSQGRNSAELMMKQTPPRITRASLQSQFESLQSQRRIVITLTFQGKTRRFTANEIGGWFTASAAAGSYQLADDKIRDSVADAGMELGVRGTNSDEIAAGIKQAISNRQAGSFTLTGEPLGKKTYLYCLGSRGVANNELMALSSKAVSTLNAKRGWSLGGAVNFQEAKPPAGGEACDFTIWLAAADQMSSFGAICDPQWSCAVRPNIIVNYDRWKHASEAWNKQGNSLEDYRTMIINHEVGHWLGFEHSACPGPGLPAPVMQQQSIELQGCSFNAWPTSVERLALRDYLGL